MLVSQKLIDRMNALVMLEIDAARGFEQALVRAADSSLQGALSTLLVEHRCHIEALHRLIRAYGGQVSERGDVEEFLAEGLMAPEAFAGGDEQILRVMRFNEAFVVGIYDDVLLVRDLPEDLRALVRKHQEEERRHLGWMERMIGARSMSERPSPPA